MPDDLQMQLEQKRDGFDAECTFVRFMVDAYGGTGGFQGRVKQPPSGYWGAAAEVYAQFAQALNKGSESETGSYLDRYPREDAPKFQRRVQVAHYLNYIKPIANLYVSYLLRKPATRKLPEKLQKWVDDTKFDDGARMRALLSIVVGWFPVVVDKPAGNEAALTAEQAGTNGGPYTVQLLPCHLVDYYADDQGVFKWAKTCVKFTRKNDWKSAAQKVERYTIWTPESWETYDVVDGQLTTAQPRSGANTFGVVPIAVYRSSVNLDDPVKSESLLAAVALEGRRLFNTLSEFDEHLRSQVFALMVWPQMPGTEVAPSIVGTDNALAYDGSVAHAPSYLAPPASVADTYEKRISATVVEMYRMARVEFTKASGTDSSAQSKEQEFEQTNLLICDLALAMAQAEKQLLTIVGLGLGISQAELDKMTVEPARDFSTEQLNDEVERVIALLTVRQLGSTFQAELLKRIVQRILPRLPKDIAAAIEQEIDDGAKQAAKEADMAAEISLTPPDVEADPGEGGDDEEEAPEEGEEP